MFWESRQSKGTFPPHLTASPLRGETGNLEIASLHLNAACSYRKIRNTSKTISTGQCLPPPRHVLRVSEYPINPAMWQIGLRSAPCSLIITTAAIWRISMNEWLRAAAESLSVSPSTKKQSLYPDGDPHRHQNLVISSMAHGQPSLKISCKSVRQFLRKVANRQINKQTAT